ncbi:MAG TPA: DUF2799 domain-containing protein [Burkholderiales bacterium]|nr:DUF2799 domain-containing protein [Burkholderiales bacterium]
MLLALLLSGCTALGESECRAANWYEIGERDALAYGLRPQFDQYAHQCAKHAVQVSEQEYMAGWVVGEDLRWRRMGGEGGFSPD